MITITFATPIDASNYIMNGSTTCPGCALRSIDYVAGVYTFQLQNSDLTLHPQVCGVNVASPSELTAAVDIRAAIALTISSS